MKICFEKVGMQFDSIKENVSKDKTYYKVCARDMSNGEYIQLPIISSLYDTVKGFTKDTVFKCYVSAESFYQESTKTFGYKLLCYNIE